MEKQVQERSAVCELCGSGDQLQVYEVPPSSGQGADGYAHICSTCLTQVENPEQTDPNHWRCLNDSMWSQVPAVQTLAWRMLTRLRGEGWPVDLLDMMYMPEETLAWAKATGEGEEAAPRHVDAFGNELQTGDTVVLTQTLNVKGSSFDAKRGTAVRGISLVHDNPEHIEGRVNGQKIVILTKYVKKKM